ncbi:MAG: FecR family protein [Crocinitomicaceae bacterium]|nr:FecR family protein [Crocinitomicaceae bacterium]
MSKEEYIEINEGILFAYLGGELDTATSDKVESWINDSEANKSSFEETKSIWEITGQVKIKPVVVDGDKAWKKVNEEISDDKVVKLAPRKNRTWIGIAAAVIILVGLSIFFRPGGDDSISMTNLQAKNELLETELPDGSLIALNTNSIISYPENFEGNERRVELKGEAFFDVERDETKPFIIDLPNDFEVRVLGTSFNIKADESETTTEVFVASGKVEVSTKNDKVYLEKNEKAIIDNSTGKITKVEANTSNTDLFWKNRILDFNGEMITEVCSVLTEVYEKEVRWECGENLPLNASFKDENLESILEVISATLEVNREIISEDGKEVEILTCKENG